MDCDRFLAFQKHFLIEAIDFVCFAAFVIARVLGAQNTDSLIGFSKTEVRAGALSVS